MNNNTMQYKICPNCKCHNDISSKFCINCGSKFEFVSTAQQQPQFTYIQCPRCQQYTESNSDSCKYCNYNIRYKQTQQYTPYQNQQGQIQYTPIYNNTQQDYAMQIVNPSANTMAGMILTLLGLIGCIISVFVPYVSANTFGYSESRSMLDNTSDSYIILVLSVIGILAAISKSGIANIIIGVINSAIGIIHIIYLKERFSELDEYTATIAKIGPAVYILTICGVLTFFGGCTILASRYNEKHFARK